MAWILLLIQLLPTLIKIIQMIREAIAREPDEGRRVKLRREMRVMARRHARELAHEHRLHVENAVSDTREKVATIEKEWQTFYDEIA